MLDDVLFIVSLTLEMFVLLYFIKYTIKYFQRYHEVVDPYTKWTLILLLLSLLLQMCRIPASALNIALELDTNPDSWFRKWFNKNRQQIQRLLILVVYLHGIV